jgi:transaldolase
MEIFVDSADMKEIKRWLDMGVVDGVTTNPSIMLKDGIYDIEAGAKEIAKLVNPRPVSVEVTTNDLDEMVEQAKIFHSWGVNIVVKIPQLNQYGVPCYGVVNELERLDIRVNSTVALSLGQVVLAAKAGATYISIFVGRVSDEGGDAPQVVRDAVDWLTCWGYKSKIIVGSIRSVGDILGAVKAGAHIITIPPQFIGKMADHKYTRETVRQFVEDAQKALKEMGKGGKR